MGLPSPEAWLTFWTILGLVGLAIRLVPEPGRKARKGQE